MNESGIVTIPGFLRGNRADVFFNMSICTVGEKYISRIVDTVPNTMRITQISSIAEFTPRNVQTTEGRSSTVWGSSASATR